MLMIKITIINEKIDNLKLIMGKIASSLTFKKCLQYINVKFDNASFDITPWVIVI